MTHETCTKLCAHSWDVLAFLEPLLAIVQLLDVGQPPALLPFVQPVCTAHAVQPVKQLGGQQDCCVNTCRECAADVCAVTYTCTRHCKSKVTRAI
jgi:hypothetical protein